MPVEYHLPKKVRLARKILRPIFRLIFRAISQVTITGLENVPPSGAYLIAFNHISLFEAPILCAFWPIAPEAMGAAEIWERPGQSTLARLYGGIPVQRNQYDRRLIEKVLAALKSGYPVVIAPEGGRSHTPGMQRAHPGIAFLMDRAQVPVVPVGVVGSTDDFLANALGGKRPSIEMHIGHPLTFPAGVDQGSSRRETRQKNADLVMMQIAALLPKNYHGVYLYYEFKN